MVSHFVPKRKFAFVVAVATRIHMLIVNSQRVRHKNRGGRKLSYEREDVDVPLRLYSILIESRLGDIWRQLGGEKCAQLTVR